MNLPVVTNYARVIASYDLCFVTNNARVTASYELCFKLIAWHSFLKVYLQEWKSFLLLLMKKNPLLKGKKSYYKKPKFSFLYVLVNW